MSKEKEGVLLASAESSDFESCTKQIIEQCARMVKVEAASKWK